MRNKALWVLAVFTLAAALLLAFYYPVKNKKLQVNRWIVSERDVTGVDISEYQAEVDMEKLAEQGVQFIYMKATEGSGHVDSRFAQNWENAQACGIPAGAYHFFSFDSPGKMQAQNYIETVGDLQGKLIPAVDVEYYGDKKENSPDVEEVEAELRDFIEALEEEYGVKPLIYSSRDVYEKYIQRCFGDYPRWVRSIYYPVTFEAGRDWVIWQYSDTGELEGYAGGEVHIDLDVLSKDAELDDLIVKE